jgi:gas vesicle protein
VTVFKKEKIMTMNGESKFSYLLIGLGLGAIGGLMSALLARKETRGMLRERGRNSLDYLNQEAGKLRESADGIVKKGKEFVGTRCDSVKTDSEAEKQAYQEERREQLGG